MSSKSYHGPVPVTSDDIKTAKEHLKETYKLNKDKIKDHKDALKRAEDAGNKKSEAYNRAHMTGHEHDNEQIERSMRTVNDVRKAKVAIMSKKSGA